MSIMQIVGRAGSHHVLARLHCPDDLFRRLRTRDEHGLHVSGKIEPLHPDLETVHMLRSCFKAGLASVHAAGT